MARKKSKKSKKSKKKAKDGPRAQPAPWHVKIEVIDYLLRLAWDEDAIRAVEMEEYRDEGSLETIADMGARAGKVELARKTLSDIGVNWKDWEERVRD